MYEFYKLEIKKGNTWTIKEQIFNYLTLYNGHAGYTFLASVNDEEEFNKIISEYTRSLNPYRDDNTIHALVVEDEDGNILDMLYEDEENNLKWSEKNVFIFPEYEELKEVYKNIINNCDWKLYEHDTTPYIETITPYGMEYKINIEFENLCGCLKEYRDNFDLDKYVLEKLKEDNNKPINEPTLPIKARLYEGEWIEQSLTKLINCLNAAESKEYSDETNKQAWELASRICKTLSDGYDDEENIDNDIDILYSELLETERHSYIRCALKELCDRLDDYME